MCKLPLWCSIVLLLFPVPSNARVWMNQWSSKNAYIVGETAALYCNITSDHEEIRNCKMRWIIEDQGDVTSLELYTHRVNMNLSKTATTMTLRNLTLRDTIMPICIAMCIIDSVNSKVYGEGGTLHIFENINQMTLVSKLTTLVPELTTLVPKEIKQEHALTWLNHVFLSINILIFIVVTIICVSYIRSQMNMN